MKFFLIVFDRAKGELVGDVQEFEDASSGLQARFNREALEWDHSDIEVVVLGAADRKALENTHSRYFGSFKELSAT